MRAAKARPWLRAAITRDVDTASHMVFNASHQPRSAARESQMSDPNELDYSDQSADDSNRTAAFLAGPHSPEDDDYDGTCVECDAPSGDASRCGDCAAAERRDRAYWNGREAHLDAAKESYVGGGR